MQFGWTECCWRQRSGNSKNSLTENQRVAMRERDREMDGGKQIDKRYWDSWRWVIGGKNLELVLYSALIENER